ncbi:MAG: DUF4136 domain-containing protein [Chitinophagia bacterium]|nr:DUF4136 domain-containing protein [Chitinophagia bacterium]
MRIFYFVIICLSFASCSGVKVLPSESAEGVNWQQYASFDFYQVDASGDTISEQFASGIAVLKQSIATQMKQRGYVQLSAQPDLLINIGLVVKELVQTRQTDWRTDGAPRYIGQRNYSWKSESIEVGRYREGTVSVHVVDARRNQLLWKGAAKGVIPDKQKQLPGLAEDAMKRVFEKYPGKVL